MHTPKVLILAGSTGYENFFTQLKENFDSCQIFYETGRMLSHIQHELSCSMHTPVYPLLLFVEYPLIPRISGYLDECADPSYYILLSFYSGNQPALTEFNHIFDAVNTGSTDVDIHFLVKKIEQELSNKMKISALQCEVTEFYEIGRLLSSERNVLKLLEIIVKSTMNLTSSDAGTIYLVVDKANGEWSSIKDTSYKDKLLKFVIARNASMDVQLEASVTPITRNSIFGYTVITGKSLKIDDAYHIDPRMEYRHDRAFDASTGYITRSVLSIPMKNHENHITGVIQLLNKKTARDLIIDYSDQNSLKQLVPYDYADELIMNSLAGQATVVLENNLLYRDMQILLKEYQQQNQHLSFLSAKVLKAHEEERKRIAREIHDGPAQSSVGLSLKLEVCKRYLEKNNLPKLSEEMNTLGNAIRSTVKEIRTIIYDLKPSYLEDGILQALKNYIQTFSENTGIHVEFTQNGTDEKIEYYLTSTLYRIVQEVLSNTFKHAHARNVKVNFSIREKDIFFEIRDDGTGFDLEEVKKRKFNKLEGGFGLKGIRERVELVRGSMSIQTAPGEGTIIIVTIPLP